MSDAPDALVNLVKLLADLPGLGRRSAERIAFHLLASPVVKARELAAAVRRFRDTMRPCPVCMNLTDREKCSVCSDPGRDTGRILVVEYPADVQAFEKTSAWDGVYHVLMGRLAPMAGVDVSDLHMGKLLARVGDTGGKVREVILATSSTIEGEMTANYIMEKLRELPVSEDLVITRIARGLPSGSEISFAQAGTLKSALEGRR